MTLLIKEPNWEKTVSQAENSYCRLILIVGPVNSGKSALLEEASIYGISRLNFGEEFSRRLLSKPIHLRSAEGEEMAIDLVNEQKSSRLAIDNTEVLFESPMRLNPLTLLKRLSINRLIVATWTGTFDDSQLVYGIKGHPAYQEFKYTQQDTFIIVPAERLA